MKSINRCSILLALLWCLYSVSVPVLAQTGGLMPEDTEMKEAPIWQPDEMGTSENYLVDLRPYLPPISRQTMNDCVGWAMGYMVKSYHETIDQNWRPNEPKRQFSPTYIYNQINKGKDRGSNMITAANLLKTQGCATLATFPYRPGDYRTQPSDAAHAEAAKFKIAAWGVVTTGDRIRTALSQGYPVVLGVRTNPLFMSGRFEIYDKALHTQGKTRRRVGQKHGFHAMVVVGYDDSQQAFLVANSWGKRWGKQGYCWIGYDAVDTIDSKKEGETFAFLAMVLVDERNPLGRDIPRIVNRDAVEVEAIGTHIGFSNKYNRHLYQFSSNLSAANETLDEIKSVTWNFSFRGQPRSIVSTRRVTGFRAAGVSDLNNIPLTAEVTYRDGQRRIYRKTLALRKPVASERNLRLVMEDQYYGQIRQADGSTVPAWWWTIRIDGDLQDQRDILSVEYHTPGMHQKGDRHRVLASSNPTLSFSGRATASNEISATINFKDGTSRVMKITPKFTSKIDDYFRIAVDWRQDGVVRGRRNYHFTLTTTMPYGWKLQVKEVIWEYGPMFRHYKPRGRDFDSDFATSGNSSREFLIKATIHLKNGKTQKLSRWVKLGPGANFPDQRRIGISTWDVYHGIENGKPTWYFSMWPVGHPDTMKKIKKITYQLPEGYARRTWVRERGDGLNFILNVRQSSVLSIPVKIELDDGTVINQTVISNVYAPRNDKLFLNTQVKQLQFNGHRWLQYYMRIDGPRIGLNDIAEVEYRLPQEYYGGRVVLENRKGGSGGAFQMSHSITKPMRVDAVVNHTDGYTERLTTYVRPEKREWKEAVSSDLNIRVRERYFGVKENRAVWAHYLSLEGLESEREQVTRVRYELPSFMQNRYRTINEGPDFTLRVETKFSINVNVEATLKDGSTRRWRVWLPCYAPRYEELQLKQRTDPVYNNGQEVRRDWLVWLVGPEVLMDQVKQVTFKYLRKEKPYSLTVTDAQARKFGGYHAGSYEYNTMSVRAIVTLKDNSIRELSIKTCLDTRPSTYDPIDRYWGLVRGRPTWQLIHRVKGNPQELQRTRSVFYGAEKPMQRRSWNGPFLHTSSLVSRRKIQISPILYYFNGGERKMTPISHMMKSPRRDDLSLRRQLTSGINEQGEKQRGVVTYVVGPESQMQKIKSVKYHLQIGDREFKRTVIARWGYAQGGFEIVNFEPNLTNTFAEITFTDGSTKRIEMGWD